MTKQTKLTEAIERLRYRMDRFTTIGNLGGYDDIRTVLDALQSQQADAAAAQSERDLRLIETAFILGRTAHVHKAGSVQIDRCEICGLDIRDPVHLRDSGIQITSICKAVLDKLNGGGR